MSIVERPLPEERGELDRITGLLIQILECQVMLVKEANAQSAKFDRIEFHLKESNRLRRFEGIS